MSREKYDMHRAVKLSITHCPREFPREMNISSTANAKQIERDRYAGRNGKEPSPDSFYISYECISIRAQNKNNAKLYAHVIVPGDLALHNQ